MQSVPFRKYLVVSITVVDSRTLGKLVAPLTINQLKEFLKDLKLESLMRIRNVPKQVVILQILERIYNKEVDKWPLEAFKDRGVIVTWFQRKKFAAFLKNLLLKDIIARFNYHFIKNMVENESVKISKIIKKAFGTACSKLKANTIQTLKNLIVALPHSCLKQIPTQQYCSAISTLAQVNIFRSFPKKAGIILRKIKSDGCSGKKFTDFTASDIQGYRYLLSGADAKFFKDLDKSQMSFEVADMLCKEPWFKGKRTVINKLREKKAPSQWTHDNLKKAWYCMNNDTCQKISKATFTEWLRDTTVKKEECLKSFASSADEVLKCARMKADEILGKAASSWGSKDTGCRLTLRTYTTSQKDAFALGPADFKNYIVLQIQRFQERKSIGAKVKRRRFFVVLNRLGEANFNMFLSEINCNMIKKNVIKVIKDLAIDVDAIDSELKKKERSELDIPENVASCVVDLYQKDKESLNKEDIAILGEALCKGVSQKQIKKFDLDTVLKMYECKALSEPKCKALSERFKELNGEIKPATICEMGSSVACLPIETLKKLSVDPEDGCSWTDQAGKADAKQVGKRKMQEMATEIVGKKDKIDKETVVRVCSLVNGFKSEDIKKLNDDAILDALKCLVTCEVKDEDCEKKHKLMVERLRKIRDGKFQDVDIETLGSLACSVLTKEDFEKMDKNTLENVRTFLTDCPWDNDKDNDRRNAVRKKLQSSSRRRRATDPSTMTAEKVLEEGTLLTPEEIRKIQYGVYLEIAKEIGEKQYTPGQQGTLEAWAYVAKNGDASKMDPSLIEKLGAVCRGFSAVDIGKMNFATDDAIQGCSQKGLSRDQIEKGLARIKELKKKTISGMSQEDLVALGYFAVGMTPSEIGSITKTVYEGVYDAFNKLTGWNEDQLVELKKKLEEIKGPISGWNEADFTEANVAVGGFTEKEIKSLSKESIQAIPVEGISSIPPYKMKYFREEQLNYLSPKQTSSLTDEQKKEVPEFCEKMKLNCPKQDGSSSANQVSMITVTILMNTVVSVASLF